eukprot:1153738-Prymnesium_polylepis.1
MLRVASTDMLRVASTDMLRVHGDGSSPCVQVERGVGPASSLRVGGWGQGRGRWPCADQQRRLPRVQAEGEGLSALRLEV